MCIRDRLAALLNISDNQLSYITNVGAGHGLIRCSGNLVPFENSFPRNTKLYLSLIHIYIRICIRIEQQSQEMEEKMRLAEQIQSQEEEQTEKNRKPRTESR